jgi:hydrogenase maturation factor
VSAPHEPCDAGHGCITCGDQALEMRVVRVDRRHGLATCADDAGHESEVDVLLLEPVEPGDRLLVHAGTAIGAAAR